MPPKKTYSRKNQEIHEEKEKENFDPFDELLSSPLKQDVTFKPLSFWNKKLNTYESSSNFKKKNCGLYEASDSGTPSPYKLNKKKKSTRRKKSDRRNLNQNVSFKGCDVSVLDNVKNYSSVVHSSGVNIFNDTFRYVTKKRQNNKYNNVRDLLTSSPGEQFKTYSNIISRDSLGDSGTNSTVNMTVVGNTSGSDYIERSLWNTCLQQTRPESTFLQDNSNWETESWCDSGTTSTVNLTVVGNTSGTDYIESSLRNTCLQQTRSESTILQDNSNWETESWCDFENCEAHSDTLKPQDRIPSSPSENDSSESNESESSDKETTTFYHPPQSSSKSEVDRDFADDIIQKSSEVKNVFNLTSKMSDMSIVEEKEEEDNSEDSPKAESDEEDTTMKGKNESSESLRSDTFRYVTRRKRGRYTRRDVSQMSNSEGKTSDRGFWDCSVDSPLTKKDRISFDPETSSCFSEPMFESTRIFEDKDHEKEGDVGYLNNGKKQLLKKTETPLEYSIVLKPGKKWRRSMAVLKQLRSGNIYENSTNKGRKFKSFVQEIIDIQKDASFLSTTLQDATLKRKSFVNSFINLKSKDSSISEVADENSVAFDRTLMDHTVKVVKPEKTAHRRSAFRTALGLDPSEFEEKDSEGEGSRCLGMTAKRYILEMCGQDDILSFEEHFNERTLKNCKKIGEGIYGEVYMYGNNIVIKILPIEGNRKFNGEKQKKFEEILSEIVCASKLSNLRIGDKRNRTSGFSEMRRVWCVRGKYPKYLLELWKAYDRRSAGSDNDSPAIFGPEQLFIILEMENGGVDLESFVFTTSEQTMSVLTQMAMSLAIAEQAFQFEHRDLHWGNILVSSTSKRYLRVLLNGVSYDIPTKGVKVSMIDFTLSRLFHDGCVIFNDLSLDPELFISHGDYQFEIYRLMDREVESDWSQFKPKTNIYWLHYVIDKMLKRVRYKNKRSQGHTKHLRRLKSLEERTLIHDNCTDFALQNNLV